MRVFIDVLALGKTKSKKAGKNPKSRIYFKTILLSALAHLHVSTHLLGLFEKECLRSSTVASLALPYQLSKHCEEAGPAVGGQRDFLVVVHVLHVHRWASVLSKKIRPVSGDRSVSLNRKIFLVCRNDEILCTASCTLLYLCCSGYTSVNLEPVGSPLHLELFHKGRDLVVGLDEPVPGPSVHCGQAD